MMNQWLPIQKNVHQNFGWTPYSHYHFAQNEMSTPLLLAEIPQALQFYPLAFIRTGEGFKLVTLNSLQTDTNLFVGPQGRWRVNYVPSFYRSYPFRLLNSPDNTQRVFCMDEASGLIGPMEQGHSKALFAENGELSAEATQILEFLQQCERNRVLTQKATDTLAEHQLLVPWSPEKLLPDMQLPQINGLYRVDETALNQLDAATLEICQKRNALSVAYGQIYSQHRLNSFKALTAIAHAEQQQAQNTPQAKDLNLDQLFGEAEEDSVFKF